MVSTRNQPQGFSPSPTKQPRSYLDASDASSSQQTMSAKPDSGYWSHIPSNLTLIWLFISLPLVIWDAGYVLLRPHSMPGGKYHKPIWVPYAIYAEVDYMYGWPAYHAKNGFTAAQSILNIVETIGYGIYLYLVFSYGQQDAHKGRGAPDKAIAGWLAQGREVQGRIAALAVLIGFGTALTTFSKTWIYVLNEVCSGFHSIGHNDIQTLVFCYIIPNGAWLVMAGYMTYVFGAEILQGLSLATGEREKKTH